jgi:hypothetical protein
VLGKTIMAATPDEVIAGALHPGERIILRTEGNLQRAMSFRFKDVLTLTNERVFIVIRQKKVFQLAHSWVLEDIPQVQFIPQTTSSQSNVLIIAGARFQVWRGDAGSMAHTIENQRVQRLQAMQAARAPPPSASPPTVVHEKETIREVVKVPCRYCGQLNLMTDKKCSSCGANIG